MRPRLRWPTVRVRLTLWYLAMLLGALVLYAGGVYAVVWRNLLAEVDQRLHDEIEAVEQLVTRTSDGTMAWRPIIQRGHEDTHEKAETEGATASAIQIWSPTGTLLTQRLSRSTAAVAETMTSVPPAAEEYASVRLADGHTARCLTRRGQFEGTPVVVRVIRSEAPLEEELRRLLPVLGLGLPVALGLAGGGGYVLARRALAPVGDIAERARAITAERLAERVPVGNPGDEFGQLAVVLNDTFARLERSFEQMRRFTADASHELRTPLTAIRSVGEVGLEEPRQASAYRDVIGNMLEETDRLTQLVDSLLLLSRADAGQVALHREAVDLAALAREVAAHLGVLAEEKGQQVRVDVDGAVDVQVDRLAVRQALINLLDNAIKYAPERSDIRVELRYEGTAALVDVVNLGPGIPAEHAVRIFDRFYRADPARTRANGGAGLGLSIARWAIEANGGTLRLASSREDETRFRISLFRG